MMDKIRNWISGISNGVVFGLLTFIFSFLFFISIFSTCVMWYDHEVTYFILDLSVLFLIGLAGFMLFLTQKKKSLLGVLSNGKKIILIATLLWFILLAGFAINTDIELVFDQASVYEAITGLINRDYTMWEMGEYMYDYPFQNGIVLLYTPLMIVFGEATYGVVQVINILFFWLFAVAGYQFAQKCFDQYVAVFTYAGILFFIPLWGYVKYFYGNLPGICLAAWAAYLTFMYLEKGKWRYAFGCAFCMLTAAAFKMHLLIYTIAIVLVILIKCILTHKKSYLLAAVFISAATFCGINGPAWIAHEITGQVTDGGIPFTEWIAMGLRECYVAPGWYNGAPYIRFMENGCSQELSTAAALESIHASWELFGQEKVYAVRFYVRKIASIWNNPEFESFAVIRKGNIHGTLSYWMKDILYNGGIINTVLLLTMNIMHSIYLFGLLLYAVYFRKKRDLSGTIPLISFIGGFLLHIFWEAKCQYTLIFFAGLLPYSFAGYRYTVFRIGCRLQEKKQYWLQRSNLWKGAAVLLLVAIIGTVITFGLRIQGDEIEFLWAHKEKIDWRADSFPEDIEEWE